MMRERSNLTQVNYPVSCSDSIRLQQQLEELQIRFVALQNKTADYESVQAELEEKKVQSIQNQFGLFAYCHSLCHNVDATFPGYLCLIR